MKQILSRFLFIAGILSGVLVQSHQGLAKGHNSLAIARSGVSEVSFQNVNQKDFSWQSLKDKKVLVVFWATWCPPCVEEFRLLGKMHQEFKGRIQIIAVSVDSDEKELRDFVAQHQPPFVVLQSKKAMADLERFQGGDGVPYSVFLKPGFVIAGSSSGEWTEKKLRLAIRKVLGD